MIIKGVSKYTDKVLIEYRDGEYSNYAWIVGLNHNKRHLTFQHYCRNMDKSYSSTLWFGGMPSCTWNCGDDIPKEMWRQVVFLLDMQKVL